MKKFNLNESDYMTKPLHNKAYVKLLLTEFSGKQHRVIREIPQESTVDGITPELIKSNRVLQEENLVRFIKRFKGEDPISILCVTVDGLSGYPNFIRNNGRVEKVYNLYDELKMIHREMCKEKHKAKRQAYIKKIKALTINVYGDVQYSFIVNSLRDIDYSRILNENIRTVKTNKCVLIDIKNGLANRGVVTLIPIAGNILLHKVQMEGQTSQAELEIIPRDYSVRMPISGVVSDA